MRYLYDAKAVGMRIKELRKGIMTQEKLAEELFLSVDSVANFENGRSTCMPEHVARICEIFNVTSDYIYYGIEHCDKFDDGKETVLDLLEDCNVDDLRRIEQMIKIYLRK